MENSLRSVFGLAKLSGFWVRGFLSEIAGELQTTFVGHEKLVETCVDGIWVLAIMNGWRPFSRFSKAKWVWVRGFLSEIAGELQTTFVGHKKLVETSGNGIWGSAIMSGWRAFLRFWVSKAKWVQPKIVVALKNRR